MNKLLLRAALLIGCAIPLATSSAQAQDRHLFGSGDLGVIGRKAADYELYLGALAYDTGLFSHQEFSGLNANVELLFPSPDFLYALGSPRPHIGVDIAAVDNGINFAYAGLTWDTYLTRKLYLTGSLGAAITDADNLKTPTEYKAMGCRVLFHLGAGVGYDLTDNVSVQLYADHFSNADLCSPNNGAESAGIRLGYRF